MKKTIKTLFVALIFLGALSLKASDGLDLKVNDHQNLIVQLQGIEKGAILSLQDKKGEVIFRNRFFEEDNYSKILDFQELPDGEYSLTLDKQYSISTSFIRKEGTNIVINDKAYSFAFKPCFREAGDKISLYLANPAKHHLQVEVFDKLGNLVGAFKSTDQILKRTLDFSQVPKGEYTVRIKTKDHDFTKSLSIG